MGLQRKMKKASWITGKPELENSMARRNYNEFAKLNGGR
jgi:hypothetical protein